MAECEHEDDDENTNFCYDCDQEVILYYTNCCKLRAGRHPDNRRHGGRAMRDLRERSSVLRYLPEVPAAGRRNDDVCKKHAAGVAA